MFSTDTDRLRVVITTDRRLQGGYKEVTRRLQGGYVGGYEEVIREVTELQYLGYRVTLSRLHRGYLRLRRRLHKATATVQPSYKSYRGGFNRGKRILHKETKQVI